MLIQLAAIGLLVTLLPLVIVWRSGSPDKYRKLAWVTLFLTFDLVLFGAFTRLTDSGLGCPDWPGCYGQANPLQAHADIAAAQALLPTGPVTVMKAWIEMIHRYAAMAVGVLIIALVVLAWQRWLRSGRMDKRVTPLLPMLLLACVCVQGAFGKWTVTMKLQPVVVTTHLLLGLCLLALLAWLAASQSDHAPVSGTARSLRWPARMALLLLFIQIALGGWVSTNYATLACPDFPLCNGTLLPQLDLHNGFTLWRELGKTATGEYLPYPALTAIHWVHRLFAVLVAIVLGGLGLRAMKTAGLRSTGRWLLIALGLQLCTGALTVFLQWPLLLAVAHNGGAALLVLLLVMLNYKTSSQLIQYD
jgi:heme a synthase